MHLTECVQCAQYKSYMLVNGNVCSGKRQNATEGLQKT